MMCLRRLRDEFMCWVSCQLSAEVAVAWRIEVTALREELLHFSKLFRSLSKNLRERGALVRQLSRDSDAESEMTDNELEPESEGEAEHGKNQGSGTWKKPRKKNCKEHKKCNNCLSCCYTFLYSYNMQSAALSNLFLTYEYILTLSCTQVSCERAFSKLKIIKSRLRASLSQDLLEAFMIMSVERDLLESVDFDIILNKIINSSELLRKMLSYW